MKPVIIFRHVACEGPGYLADILKTRGIPYDIIKIDEGEDVTANLDNISGLVFMGGPMSVNDPLPWIDAELDLIRAAHNRTIPVLGHCLGGQLVSKALGGRVERNAVTEIGWFPLMPVKNENMPAWLNDLDFDTEIFHWHGETFSLPDHAVPLFKSKHCINQGFIINNTYALQCHVEMGHADIAEWLEFYENDVPTESNSVQSAKEMLRNGEQRVTRLHQFADIIYTAWLDGFRN